MTMQADISVKGRVQGIFFRAVARQKARELGLSGWVRNEDDGSVSICAQGPDAELEQFIDWCRLGPPGAKIDGINVNKTELPAATFQGFEIR